MFSQKCVSKQHLESPHELTTNMPASVFNIKAVKVKKTNHVKTNSFINCHVAGLISL